MAAPGSLDEQQLSLRFPLQDIDACSRQRALNHHRAAAIYHGQEGLSMAASAMAAS